MASSTSTHRLRMKATSTTAVRCCPSERPAARASTKAVSVATATMLPAGMAKRSTRPTNPGR